LDQCGIIENMTKKPRPYSVFTQFLYIVIEHKNILFFI
jgi:hypothetical protein